MSNETFYDYKHANNLYTSFGHLYSPKVKFLYHLTFLLSDEARNFAGNTVEFTREIGVLAKSADLPGYRVSVDTVQQYNRKKNIQTRIDYDEVRLVFHDDKLGITRAMLEEYYNYYFRDGLNKSGTAFTNYNPRDTYGNLVPRYGLDNNRSEPFFKNIKIFQLSKGRWFGYTLINPLLTAWQHDTLEYGDGSGIMENTISVAYEGIVYSRGNLDEGDE